ncbi:MAG: hypothetical protein IJD35_00735, partial [Clostridia bacterium]|nr:hypothetical protein [Clostridia bacterium]
MNINSHQFFDLLNEADSSYLAAAHKSMTAKPARMWVRPALIAACLTLVLVAIPVGILMGNRTIKPTIPVIDPSTSDHTVTTTQAQVPQTTARPSILDIPGATVFDENDKRFLTSGSAYSGNYSVTEEEKLEAITHMKENNSVVVGIIKDFTSVLVEDGDAYYRLNTMEIQVKKSLSGVKKETVTAVYACRYELDNRYYIPATIYQPTDSISVTNDMFEQALMCTEAYAHHKDDWAGLFLIKDAKNEKITIGATSYSLSDYADYVMEACGQWDASL